MMIIFLITAYIIIGLIWALHPETLDEIKKYKLSKSLRVIPVIIIFLFWPICLAAFLTFLIGLCVYRAARYQIEYLFIDEEEEEPNDKHYL